MKPDQFISWIFAVVVAVITIFFSTRLMIDFYYGDWVRFDTALNRTGVASFQGIIKAIILILLSAFLSTYIVRYFRSSRGNLEINALGIKLTGPAGPILLWCVSFLVISSVAALLINSLS